LRNAALATARDLVDAGEPLGLRELGRQLGVSHAAIHHHFPTVDGLAAELCATWFADLDRAMAHAVDRVAPSQPLARFRALGLGYVRYALAYPHRYRLLFRAGPSGLVREADASFKRVLDAVVACAQHAGRPVDPLAMTVLAWSAMHGLAMLWLDGAFRNRLERPGIDALAERMSQLISQLLAPEHRSA
jgi:AcrR family transcriptional regulator